jgi:DNA-binding PadR family transcriptional regulator
MQHMGTTVFDREFKKGSTELLILSLIEDRPRHGYEIIANSSKSVPTVR